MTSHIFVLQFLSIFSAAVGMQLIRQHSSNTSTGDSGCIGLTINEDGTLFTAPVTIGTGGDEIFDIIVDTGSTQLLMWSEHATNSTAYSGSESTISFGSGDLYVEEATDQVELGLQLNNETFFLIQDTDASSFYYIEGILPLSMEEYNVLHTDNFSVCFNDDVGTLKLSSTGASIPADTRWEMQINSISMGDAAVGVTSGVAMLDTGTTLLLGPLDHLDLLFVAGCAEWSKCDGTTSLDFLDTIEAECSTDLPDLKFELGGEMVTITSSSLVMTWEDVCYVAFDYIDYDDFWVLGLPIFYSNEVAFDAANSMVGFTPGSCSACGDSLAQTSNGHVANKKLRVLTGPPARPTMKSSDKPPMAKYENTPHLSNLATALNARPFNKLSARHTKKEKLRNGKARRGYSSIQNSAI